MSNYRIVAAARAKTAVMEYALSLQGTDKEFRRMMLYTSPLTREFGLAVTSLDNRELRIFEAIEFKVAPEGVLWQLPPVATEVQS